MKLKIRIHYRKSVKQKPRLFGKINKINVSSQTKKKERKNTIYKYQKWKEAVTTDFMHIKRIIKEKYEWLYAHEFNNLDEMYQFLQRQIC
jgi:hypothetical protein